MNLTPQQQLTLKSLAAADQTAAAYMASGDDTALAAWFNAASAYVAWKPSAKRDELQGEGFDWAQVDNLTVGQARIWDWIFNSADTLAPPLAGVRNGIAECWKGTAAKVAVATYVLSQCKRTTTRAEAALSSGAGTNASPGLLSATATGLMSLGEASDVRVN